MAKPKSELNQIIEDLGLAIRPAESLHGREFDGGGVRHLDFCGTSYLGWDLDPRVIARGYQRAQEWGAVSGWSRLEVDPQIYPALESRIGRWVGASDVILAHTITITGFSIIPAIVGKGVIFCDQKLHTVVWEACRLARDHGATLHRFNHQDLNHLESLLKAQPRDLPKLIAVDGVYSITTEVAPIREMQELCRRYNAWLYVDDAHGLGVIGRDPTAENPYGVGGGGAVLHQGASMERTFYVSSFNKALSTSTAFTTVPREFTENLRSNGLQYVFSSPISPFTLGTVEAVMDLNESEGEVRRARLRQAVDRFTAGLRSLGLRYQNLMKHPVVLVEIGDLESIKRVVGHLNRRGLVAGIRAYPLVPEGQGGLRFALTATHTDRQIDLALEYLAEAQRVDRAA